MLPPSSIDEVFLCGPEGMIAAAERALRAAGVVAERIHAERFFTESMAPVSRLLAPASDGDGPASRPHRLDVVLDGKTHHLAMDRGDKVLDVALEAGLDLP